MSSLRAARCLVGLLAAALLVSGCSSLRGTGDLNYVAGDGQVVQVATSDRESPVRIAGDSLQGRPVDLADHRGEVVVLNVWGSWCAPCRREAPILVRASDRLDAAFVGINIRDASRDNGLAFEREFGVEYPSIHDEGGETLLRLGSYAPRSAPATVILDEQGRVAALINGVVPSETTLTELVKEIAAEDA